MNIRIKSEIVLTTLIGAALLLTLLLWKMPVALAVTVNQTTVSVNIASVTQITVLPTNFTFSGLQPTQENFTEATNGLIVKNSGSTNVSDLYASLSTVSDESTNPLGIGIASNFAAGGFVWIRNSTNTQYYHGGRLEWNLSNLLTGEVLNLGATTTAFGHGFYRNATGGDFLWKVENGTGGFCNNSGAKLTMKTNADSGLPSDRDFSGSTNPNTYEAVSVTGGTDWGFFALPASGPLASYCVAAYEDCSKIFMYQYDKSGEFGSSCANSLYLTQNTIVPGDEFSYCYIGISIPAGVPAGDTKQSLLTIWASAV